MPLAESSFYLRNFPRSLSGLPPSQRGSRRVRCRQQSPVFDHNVVRHKQLPLGRLRLSESVMNPGHRQTIETTNEFVWIKL
jgi:hypothetical protein